VRTAYRVLSTAVAVGAIFPFGMAPAHADTSPVKVETAAWFWSQQVTGEIGDTGVGYPVTVPVKASGVPEGDLAVAYKGDKEADGTTSKPDKETYLAWDVYFIPEGSYVDSFTFTMPLDPEAEQLFGPAVTPPAAHPPVGGQPAIVACVPTIGFGEASGESFTLKPTDDCSNQLYGSFDEKTQSYTFDASTYAQDWVDGKDNTGLAIRPQEDASDPFQLVFKGAKDITATISYTPAAEDGGVAPPVVDTGVPLPIQPPSTGSSGYVPAAPVAQPVPQPAPQPAPVVMQTRAPVAVQNVAASPLRSSRGLSPVFWFAMLGGAMLLGATSLILGDPLEAVAGSRDRVRTNGRHRLNVPATGAPRTTRPVRPRTV